MSRVSEFLTENLYSIWHLFHWMGKLSAVRLCLALKKMVSYGSIQEILRTFIRSFSQPVCPDQRFFPYISVDPSEWKSCFC